MNEQHEPYIPVECGLHSEYELAIMHQVMLQLAWTDQDGKTQHHNILPIDLKTMNKKEYLVGKTPEGEIIEIRLDKISQSDVNEVNKL